MSPRLVALIGLLLSLAILVVALRLFRRSGRMSTKTMRGFFAGFMLAAILFAFLSFFGALGPYLQGVIGAPFLAVATGLNAAISSWFRAELKAYPTTR